MKKSDWAGLAEALKPADIYDLNHSLDWLESRTLSGSGIFVSLQNMAYLWQTAQDSPVKTPEDERMTAGMMYLYTYAQIIIDGKKCGDKTALSHRIEQLMAKGLQPFQYLKTLPLNMQQQAIDVAVKMEAKTANAPLRVSDDLICRDGMEQISAGIKNGTQHEVPPDGTHVGKQIAVEAPVGWRPSILSPDAYMPLQMKARDGLTQTLAALLR